MMLPPVVPAQGPSGPDAEGRAAALEVTPSIGILRRRADFLRAAQARRQGTAGFLLQARRREDAEPSGADIRVGFTCSKKIGNAVLRNRAKRRLRALSRAVMLKLAHPGWDYVLVGRPQTTVSRAFADMLNDLQIAMNSVHGAPVRQSVPR